MSPRYAAVLARAAMFELEALEPRRFLSSDAQAVEIPLRDEISFTIRFDEASSARQLIHLKAGVHYVFETWSLPGLRLVNPLDDSPLVPLRPEGYSHRIQFYSQQSQTAELLVRAEPEFGPSWGANVDAWAYGEPSDAKV